MKAVLLVYNILLISLRAFVDGSANQFREMVFVDMPGDFNFPCMDAGHCSSAIRNIHLTISNNDKFMRFLDMVVCAVFLSVFPDASFPLP